MSHWVTAWAFAHCGAKAFEQKLAGRTQMTSFVFPVSGEQVRIRLSNHYGISETKIEKISVYNAATGLDPVPITFGKRFECTVFMGQSIISDAVPFSVRRGDTVEVRVLFAKGTRAVSGNGLTFAKHSEKGDHTGDVPFAASEKNIWKMPIRLIDVGEPTVVLSQVDVLAEGSASGIAVLGDSNGFMGTWTKPLAAALVERLEETALLNMSISGNRLVSDSPKTFGKMFGYAAIKRFEWDVVPLCGVRWLIVAIGGNDLYQPGTRGIKSETVPAKEKWWDGLMQLVEMAHARGMKVAVATLTSFKGTDSHDETRDRLAKELREDILVCPKIDQVLDFYSDVIDEATGMFRPEYDRGDHLHLSDAGGAAIAEYVMTLSFLFLNNVVNM